MQSGTCKPSDFKKEERSKEIGLDMTDATIGRSMPGDALKNFCYHPSLFWDPIFWDLERIVQISMEGSAMSQEMFTQTLCVLLNKELTLEEVARSLSEFQPKRREQASEGWEFSGPSLIFRVPNIDNSHVVVDLVSRPWPDDMGFDKQDSVLFQAWDAGQFGPFTFPGSLERASEQSWGWPDGETVPGQVAGFIRVRLGNDSDADDFDAQSSEEFDPLKELEAMTRICSSLLRLPQTICYFNPSGEVLRDRQSLEESQALCEEHSIPTIDLWSNVRLFRFDNDWALMDTVGNSQLGLPDIEACFDAQHYEFNSVDQLLRTLSMYLVENEEFEDGEEVEDEAGVTWRMTMHDDSLCDPPRAVIRILPNDGREVPEELEESAG